MVRPERATIGEHPVEVDEGLVGGKTREEGRGGQHKAIVIGAVEVRRRPEKEDRASNGRQRHAGGKPLRKRVYAGRLRLRVIADRSAANITHFVTDNITKGSTVKTDGWQCDDGLRGLGCHHDPLVMAGDPDQAEAHLPMIPLVFSNLKAWINGTHHGRIPIRQA